MSTPEAFAELKVRGVTAEGARCFVDGSSENLDPGVLAALTDANLTESQLHEYVAWVGE
ncbi:hypothetical protein GCM10007304_33160 [Rhodococcoides trifolii]|uniref:Uncharacterized protein n=1 Tax=Rhodococcoides trifolii TaxID=908250 RepID=A0A917G0A6_9NOCA|nr:hypothetical protein [Rhodococcus trifolii]GGG16412.1 hypothetical protein GCM10007304_33160 [Rhodococcus trifolii]